MAVIGPGGALVPVVLEGDERTRRPIDAGLPTLGHRDG
jgi:hypothetical protein